MEKIDECLSVRDEHLFVEDCDTTDLVREFGSPIFVLSEAMLRSNVRRFRRAFASGWPEGAVDVLPAFKANWTLATRRILTEEGAGGDVYSEGELHGALAAGVDPELISVNGGGKSEAMIERCVRAGARITVEDLDEPDLIDHVARRLDKKAKVRLRVKPSFPELWKTTHFAQSHASIDLGIQAYKGGIPAQYLPELGRKVLALPSLELKGFHLHLGRHHPTLWYWERAMKRYAELIAELCEAWGGYRPAEIDVGGGFASRRDPFDKSGEGRDVLLTCLSYPLELALRALGTEGRYRALNGIIERFFTKAPSAYRAPAIEEYGRVVSETLSSELRLRGVDPRGIRLQVEPGRGVYGSTGIHLARVKKVKRQTRPIELSWILTDTTCFFFAGGTLEHQLHDFRIANKATARAVEVADVVGHSCFSDRILPFMRVPHVEPGDVVAFLDMGAYEEVSASNFNALPRPATVLVDGSRAEVIRRAETIEDVYRRDVVPERLKQSEPAGAVPAPRRRPDRVA